MIATPFVSAATSSADSDPKVRHGYLPGAATTRPVFVSYHPPQPPLRNVGYVICPPLAWEAIQSYVSLRRLAEQLAAAGFPTLRVHYDGTGESLGDDDDPGRVAAWLESIGRAASTLAATPGVQSVALVGMRLGATLAAALARDVALRALVLWEPCVRGGDYARELQILSSAAPGVTRVSLEGDAPASVASGAVEATGYRFSAATLSDLGALDTTAMTPRAQPDVLLLCRNDRPAPLAKKLVLNLEKAGCLVTSDKLPGYKDMMVAPERSLPAVTIIQRICDWAIAREDATPAEDAHREALVLQSHADDGVVRHRPVRFGPERRLFGVITEPRAAADRAATPIVFLTGGVVPRTSVNRMYIALAKRLAARGHTVLRVDVSGIGETPPAGKLPESDPYAPSLLGDVRAAVDALLSVTGPERSGGTNETGQKQVRLMGLCSGAYAAFHAALGDERVRTLVCLNPMNFHFDDEAPAWSRAEQHRAAQHYRASLRSFAAWKKLLSGKANVAFIRGLVTARARTALATLRERWTARVRKAPQGLAGNFFALLTRGTAVHVVMAEGEPGYAPLMDQLAQDLDLLRARGFVMKMVPGPDHTFNDFSVREPLLEWLLTALST